MYSDFFTFRTNRTSDGEMFVVKDPELFASKVVPLYFDHNKFSSFARQLNFYGFRKMQAKPIRNSDYDAGTAKHVTFYNENFKRGRCDLLKMIQRSTRGGTAATGGDPAKELQNLREYVSNLEQKITDMNDEFEDRVRRLELDMLARIEQMMVSVQQQPNQNQFQKATSIGSVAHSHSTSSQSGGGIAQTSQGNNTFLPYPRGDSIQSSVSLGLTSLGAPNGLNTMNSFGFQQPQMQLNSMAAPPTLPPHPKQKQVPLSGFPPMNDPADRLNSLRGLSQFSRGLSRGASGESSASATLLRNSWDEKLFSMLMSEGDHGGANLGESAVVHPTPMAEGHGASVTAQVVSNRLAKYQEDPADDGANDMSSVSSSDIP